MIGHPKHKRWKSEKYLKFIREQPCIICGQRAEPHHVRMNSNAGTGIKPDDTWSLPLCRLHHAELHHPEFKHKEPFFERHGIDVYQELFKMTKKYIEIS